MGEQKPRMDPDVTLGMVFRRLGATAHLQKFGNPGGDQPGVMEEVKSAGRVGAGENFNQLLPDALGSEVFGFGGEASEGRPGLGLDGEAKLDGKPDGAEEAETVLGEAGGGIADRADGLGGQVRFAAHIVEDLVFQGVKEHPVDGEVPALGVFLGGGEGDRGGASAIQIGAIDPKGGDFKHMIPLFQADHPESLPLGIGSFRKKRLNLVGRRRGGDVHVRKRPV